MASTLESLRNRVYEYCGLSSSRVATSKVDEWISRGVSQVVELIEENPQLWDALMFLETIEESEAIDVNNTVKLPDSYLKLHRDMTVRGRNVKIVDSIAARQRSQDDFDQATVEEPQAVIVPNSTSDRTEHRIKFYPTKFKGDKVLFRYLKAVDEDTQFSDQSVELLVASASIIGLEPLKEMVRLNEARAKYALELQKFKVTLQ